MLRTFPLWIPKRKLQKNTTGLKINLFHYYIWKFNWNKLIIISPVVWIDVGVKSIWK